MLTGLQVTTAVNGAFGLAIAEATVGLSDPQRIYLFVPTSFP